VFNDPVLALNVNLVAVVFADVKLPVALDAKTGAIIQDTIEAEAKQVMENLHYILTDAGTSFNNVLKCTIFVTDLANWDVINKVYGSYFDGLAPARETVQVVALPKGAQVEISCIASGGY
jgi:2-iminobutanoate/2-iminopropanoate deaminase